MMELTGIRAGSGTTSNINGRLEWRSVEVDYVLLHPMAVRGRLDSARAVVNDGHLLEARHGHVPLHDRPSGEAVVSFPNAGRGRDVSLHGQEELTAENDGIM